MYKSINAWSRRKAHPRLRWLGREVFHILLTFIIGVAIATVYHQLVISKFIRSSLERVCTVYGRDEQECKAGIDDILDESEQVLDNNLNVKGE